MIKFKIDTGADVTMIPSTTYDLYYDGPLHCTKTHLVGPGQNELKVSGWFEGLLPKVKCELEKMEREGVISKINEPTDWCSGMVVVPKLNN